MIFLDILHVLSIINQFSLLCSSLSFHTHFSTRIFSTRIFSERIFPHAYSTYTRAYSATIKPAYITLVPSFTRLYKPKHAYFHHVFHPVFTTILTHPDYSTLSESRLDTAQTTRAILLPPFTSVYG